MALDAGVSLDVFWRQTPRETAECLRSHARRRRLDFEVAIWAAWHVEAFARCERLPELVPLLSRVRGEGDGPDDDDQDADAQMNAARAIVAAFGATEPR